MTIKKNNSIYKNAKYLAAAQILNYIIPFLMFPYLTRVLGSFGFGEYIFAIAIATYISIIMDFGFNLSAVRDIAKNKSKGESIASVFDMVISAKAILLIPAIVASLIMAWTASESRHQFLFYLGISGAAIIQSYTPIWIFQGVERLDHYAFVTLIPKIIVTIGAWIFVKTTEELLILSYVHLAASTIGVIIGMHVVNKHYIEKKITINLCKGYQYLLETKYIFFSQIKISFFANSTTILLGLIAGNVQVSYYAVSEKIMRGMAMLQGPVVGSLYPFIARNVLTEPEVVREKIKYYSVIGIIIYLIMAALIFPFANIVMSEIFGNEFSEAAIALRILLIVPCFIYINNMFGTQILLNIGKERVFLICLLAGGIIHMIVCPFLIVIFGYIGAAVATTITEGIVAYLMYYNSKDFVYGKKI